MTRTIARSAVAGAIVLMATGILQARELILKPERLIAIASPTDGRDVRTLVYFELPEGLREVDNAFLVFRGEVEGADFGMVEVLPVTKDWTSAGTVTWESPWDSVGGDYSGRVARSSITLKRNQGDKDIKLNVTLIVKAWLEGAAPNNGIVMLISKDDMLSSASRCGIDESRVKLRILY